MKRRSFLYTAGLSGIGLSLGKTLTGCTNVKEKKLRETSTLNGNSFSIYTNAEVKATKVFHITDTHLFLDDERGEKYSEFSKRMAGAYRSNKHFKTGETIPSNKGFEEALKEAKKQNADFIAITGDLFSFPSEAAVEWVLDLLEETAIPFAFVAGNHDWHFEGMKGSSNFLRETWTQKLLKPMYQGNNPLCATYNINGIRFVCIDNSTYEILPEQLDFYRQQVSSNEPLVLLIHIPLYIPGHNLDFGCGHPEWGEKNDKNFEIERREKWRKGGHTETTFKFHDEVFNTPNLLAILTGHTHHLTLDIKNDIPQLVSGHNASGYYTQVSIYPF